MTIPSRLERPTLDAIPYINYIFHDQRIEGIKHIIPHAFTRDSWDFDDACFDKALFPSAERVGAEQVAALAAMTDETFKRLVGGFRASVNDCLIRHRADLVLASSFTAKEHPGATPEQSQSFLLHGARHTFEVHWAEVADIYNGSPPDQQQAIIDFFDNFLNRQLPELMKAKGPGPVPDSLLPAMRTRNIDGETLVQCLTRGDWVREDLLVNRFSVAAKRMMAGSEYHLLAYASSIIEALAQATAYAINIDPESELFTLQIAMDDVVVSSTRLISAGADKARPGKHRLPIRLDWGGSGSKELNDEAFRHAAIKVEKHFGKRWSLVKKLEDELGL